MIRRKGVYGMLLRRAAGCRFGLTAAASVFRRLDSVNRDGRNEVSAPRRTSPSTAAMGVHVKPCERHARSFLIRLFQQTPTCSVCREARECEINKGQRRKPDCRACAPLHARNLPVPGTPLNRSATGSRAWRS